MKISNAWKLVLSFLVTFAAAAIGSLFTFKSIPTWYATLHPTSLTPPNWVFGPVWTILYILMAIAAYLVWKNISKQKKVGQAMNLFYLQLVLNALWSILFFGQHLILAAFIEIILLWFAIILTIIWFSKVSRAAAWLMAPYILWVSFAGILNFMVYLANK
jgi:tryptophan-rich sensory protein